MGLLCHIITHFFHPAQSTRKSFSNSPDSLNTNRTAKDKLFFNMFIPFFPYLKNNFIVSPLSEYYYYILYTYTPPIINYTLLLKTTIQFYSSSPYVDPSSGCPKLVLWQILYQELVRTMFTDILPLASMLESLAGHKIMSKLNKFANLDVWFFVYQLYIS